MTMLLACCLALGSSSGRTTAKVDMLEINHVIRDDGSEFVQWIAWDWEPSMRAHCVVDWQRYECDDVYRIVNGRYQVRWDRCEIAVRYVEAASFIETWTRHDREVENQNVWRPAMRRQLW